MPPFNWLGETLEHAVLLSVAKEDKDGFTRHVSQLKPLYIGGRWEFYRPSNQEIGMSDDMLLLPLTVCGYSLPCTLSSHSCTPGDNRSTVTGLNLMFLLVENRLSEFHSEV